MTYADFTARRPRLLEMVLAPFHAVGRGLIWMAENNSKMDAVQRLSKLSDEDLAARGLNRADEVRRIFASAGAL